MLIFVIDYCIAAFAVIISISVFQWIVDGRKNFTGPQLVSEGQNSITAPAPTEGAAVPKSNCM